MNEVHKKESLFIPIAGVALAVVCLLVVLFALLPNAGIDGAAHYNKQFHGTHGTLYIRGVGTGITTNHQMWWITSSANSDRPDSSSDYVWHNVLQPFFYRFDRDTLFLKVSLKVPTPQSFDSKITVVQDSITTDRFSYIFAHRDSLLWTLAEM